MKIMMCGKGGCGKSALTVLMARVLSEDHGVYIVDSDESNELLPRILGVESPTPLVEYLGGKDQLFEKGEVNIVKALSEAGKGVKLSSLPDEYISSSSEGVRLLSIGKVREYGEGCACPFNFLARALLKSLELKDGEIVLVDTDAGVEHMGRGVEEGCDVILAIVDPTAESLELAKILKQEADRLDKKFWLVANKVSPDVADIIKSKIEKAGLELMGSVRRDEKVFRSGLQGEKLESEEAIAGVEDLLENIGLIEKS
ncbi:MAG: ATP-binding protein [Thermoproteota archaeon]